MSKLGQIGTSWPSADILRKPAKRRKKTDRAMRERAQIARLESEIAALTAEGVREALARADAKRHGVSWFETDAERDARLRREHFRRK